MVFAVEAWRFLIVTNLIWRCVDTAGADKIVVVVAVVILPSEVDGTKVVVVISAYDIE